MHFWLNRGGQNFGPYTLPQLIDMATAGTVAPTEPVRHQYGAAWVPLGVQMATSEMSDPDSAAATSSYTFGSG